MTFNQLPQYVIDWLNETDQSSREEKRQLMHEYMMSFGKINSWWDKWDDKGPFRTINITLDELPPNAIEAHALLKAEIFGSIGEGRKNGFTNVLVKGNEIFLKKRRTFIKII